MAKKASEDVISYQRCIGDLQGYLCKYRGEGRQSSYLGDKRRREVMKAIRELKEEIKDENR